jgi:hypothetical protein
LPAPTDCETFRATALTATEAFDLLFFFFFAAPAAPLTTGVETLLLEDFTPLPFFGVLDLGVTFGTAFAFLSAFADAFAPLIISSTYIILY